MEKYFDRVKIWAIISVFIIISILIPLVSEIPLLKSIKYLDENFWMSISNFLVILYFFLILKIKKDDLKSTLSDFKSKVKWREIIMLTVLDFVLLISIMAIFIILMYKIDPKIIQEVLAEPTVKRNMFSTIFLFIFTVISAPIVEEIVFRGILFRKISYKYGVNVGITLSSIIFALVHVETAILVFTAGLILSVLYLKYNNILISIVTHGMFNLVLFLLEFVPADESEAFILSQSEANLALTMGTIGLIVSGICLIKYLKKNYPKKEDRDLIFKSIEN